MSPFKKIIRSVLLTVAAVSLCSAIGCKSKPKDESADAAGAGQIESMPMNFDAAGSDSGAIAGLKTLYFEYDRAVLSAEAKAVAQGNANWLKENPKMKLQIEGHCDSRGSIEYNLSLGERRAQAVRAYMVSLGADKKRLSIISYGKEKLLSAGESESDHQKNRRANFLPIAL